MQQKMQNQRRRQTRRINVGNVPVGDGAPISVQTMTKTDGHDIDATVFQIHEVATVGCDIVRLAVIDKEAAEALAEIGHQVSTPIIADIHFDYKLALTAIESGISGLRINPGNIGAKENIEKVVRAAAERDIPIRIGVNGGSLEKDLEDKYGPGSAEALVESALRHVDILEKLNFHQIKISVKATDVHRTIESYRLLSEKVDYPLHLGLTEAGTFMPGIIKSSVAMGILLNEGIGDTIRISLTDTPVNEIKAGLELLRCLGLREPGPSVISCPTCGRVQVKVMQIAGEVEARLEEFYQNNPDAARPIVAVMGCMVNGPGEAKEADVAIAGGNGKFALYINGEFRETIPESSAVDVLLKYVAEWK